MAAPTTRHGFVYPGHGGEGEIAGADGEESGDLRDCPLDPEPASCTTTTTIPQCCPVPCREREPLNASPRTLTYQETSSARTLKITAVYDPCGNRDQFGNCAEKYTFTCSAYGQSYECTGQDANVVLYSPGNLLLGSIFCGLPGSICSAGPISTCSILVLALLPRSARCDPYTTALDTFRTAMIARITDLAGTLAPASSRRRRSSSADRDEDREARPEEDAATVAGGAAARRRSASGPSCWRCSMRSARACSARKRD